MQVRMGQIVGRDVRTEMMHRHQGLVCRQGQPLGEIHPDQQRADESRRVGDRHGVDIRESRSRLVQRLANHPADGLRVAAAGDFRHHPAIQLMFLHLGGDDVGQHRPSVHHHRRRRFVAGGFDS